MQFADEPAKGGSMFRVISESGDDVPPGQRGLLLYKGATVCSKPFSTSAANDICRELGYTRAMLWDSGNYPLDFQERFDIAFTKIDGRRPSDDWRTYSVLTHNGTWCNHFSDVFIACATGI